MQRLIVYFLFVLFSRVSSEEIVIDKLYDLDTTPGWSYTCGNGYQTNVTDFRCGAFGIRINIPEEHLNGEIGFWTGCGAVCHLSYNVATNDTGLRFRAYFQGMHMYVVKNDEVQEEVHGANWTVTEVDLSFTQEVELRLEPIKRGAFVTIDKIFISKQESTTTPTITTSTTTPSITTSTTTPSITTSTTTPSTTTSTTTPSITTSTTTPSITTSTTTPSITTSTTTPSTTTSTTTPSTTTSTTTPSTTTSTTTPRTTTKSHDNVLYEFLDVEMEGFADWMKEQTGGNPVPSNVELEILAEPVYNGSGTRIGQTSAGFEYSVDTSGPTSYEVFLPSTSLQRRMIGLSVNYDWLKFAGSFSIRGELTCNGQVSRIEGSGPFELGSTTNILPSTVTMYYRGFTVSDDGFILLNEIEEKSLGLTRDDDTYFHMDALTAGGCEADVKNSLIIAVRKQIELSYLTVHPEPLYTLLDKYLRKLFEEHSFAESHIERPQ